MDILVVGCGKVGSEIVRDLAGEAEVDRVIAADASSDNLKRLRPIGKVETRRVDISQKNKIRQIMRGVDLVCGAVPGRLGFQVMTCAVDSGRDLVDISYTPENPFKLQKKSLEKEIVLVPQCGVAPGLSNMFVGDAMRRLGRIGRARIFVGGLPQKPVPPLNYRIVFSLEDVINEYSRPVHIIENGQKKQVEPLTGRGFLTFPRVGRLEYFLTDGLGSLPRSFPNVREMSELTLRYPGHADMMETLRVLGFFDRRKLLVDDVEVEPRRLSLELLKDDMMLGGPEDLLAMKVEVESPSRTRGRVTYQVLDYYDRRRKVSAMSRTTAYPCTSVALLVGMKRLGKRGVVTPERIAQNQDNFRYVLDRLKKRRVEVKIRTS
ncbi:MAG TPA: saccharopine dehydrogenase C-terminal domain-containing protein [Candidatus Dormibacteraeota bacterium]|nr:saccharopine dehydrogenase C-terminal domain-containing protein [Candidatus Dormibacteraeota bacterium]